MKQFALFLLFNLLIVFNVAAKSFYTTQEVHIRAGAGKNYEILGTLKKGQSIEVNEVVGAWGKIAYQNKEGFITMKLLSQIAPINNINQKKLGYPITVGGLIGGLFGLSIVLYVLYQFLLGILHNLGLRSTGGFDYGNNSPPSNPFNVGENTKKIDAANQAEDNAKKAMNDNFGTNNF